MWRVEVGSALTRKVYETDVERFVLGLSKPPDVARFGGAHLGDDVVRHAEMGKALGDQRLNLLADVSL